MGNLISSGTNNDDLVDRLKLLGYIKSKKIENVFRAVDRGNYVSSDNKNGVYTDLSWKVGNIHLSAPCVYARVMEELCLKSGLSFLNIGSGTGYLSTMVGLILNYHGTNHGVELNEDCVEFASKKMEEFKTKSHILDQFHFCEPVFIQGNFCKFLSNRRYDRVYCGAECPESYEIFIKQFVKIGGILIMPYKGHLLKIERIDEDIWKDQIILPVTFAPLIIPEESSNDSDYTSYHLPLSEPLSLQEICRFSIRCEIQKQLWFKYPELESIYIINQTKSSPTHQNKSSIICQPVPVLYKHELTILPLYEETPDNKEIINGINDKYNKSIMKNKSQLSLYSLEKIKGQMIVTKVLSPIDFTNTITAADLFKFAEENSILLSKKLSTFPFKDSSVTDTNYLLACLKTFHFSNSNMQIDINDDCYNKTRYTTDRTQCDDLSENNHKWGISCSNFYTIPQQQSSQISSTDNMDVKSLCCNDIDDIQENQVYYGHKVNSALLSYYMKQKIFQLPLPIILRSYINNNHHNF